MSSTDLSIAPVGAVAAIPATSGVGLAAQLARRQKQLADCEDCPSSKTAEGKAKIAQLQQEVEALRDAMRRQAEAARTSVGQATPQPRDVSPSTGGMLDTTA